MRQPGKLPNYDAQDLPNQIAKILREQPQTKKIGRTFTKFDKRKYSQTLFLGYVLESTPGWMPTI